MTKKWLGWINLCLGGAALLFTVAAAALYIALPGEIPVPEDVVVQKPIPKNAFAMPKEAYHAIGAPLLTLQFSPLTMQLPDLRQQLIYYGKNGRPDAREESTLLHFGFVNNKATVSLPPGRQQYILYDKSQMPGKFIFSPNNGETSLWFEAISEGNEAVVSVGMKNEKGEVIREPSDYARFKLPEKEFVRFGGTPWEIGKWRVDGTLLARQRARWYGSDMFMEKHGGKEYAHLLNKQRIDFGEGDEAYSVYVGPGDTLGWEKDKWHLVKPGEDSRGFPLLVVKKIDERLMNLELWDVDGKNKVALNLLKSSEAWVPQNIQQAFKFVGARTRSQFVFEINKTRMFLSPHDWLLLTDKGWKKLITPQEIDDYVDRKVTGPLFVFDAVIRKDDKQYLQGTLFNASRTQSQPIEILLQKGGAPIPAPPSEKQKLPEHEPKNGEPPLPQHPYAKIKQGGENVPQE